jgi:formylglycine-generating enzyme required for sulfatase activity
VTKGVCCLTELRPPHRAWFAALLFALLLPVMAEAQDLALDVRQAMLRERAVEVLKSGDVDALYSTMDEFRELEKDGGAVPPGLFFAEAEAARNRGHLVRAERAFNDYFRVANKSGTTFDEALRVYPEFRSSIPAQLENVFEGMTSIPSGKIQMRDEELVLGPFSLGRHEVTRGQFLVFVTATDYRPQPAATSGDGACDIEQVNWKTPGFDQTDEHPVVCVNVADALAYIAWLNQWSSLKFRLPTETEWEYAARAGTGTAYWYGDEHDPARSNGLGATGRDQWAAGTAPVGQFPANPFGLKDMLGNVSEWVADCADSEPAGVRSCIVRGGNWTSDASGSQASFGTREDSGLRSTHIGFRLAAGP